MAENIRYLKVDPSKWAKVVGFEPGELKCISCGKMVKVDVPIIVNNVYIGYEMRAHGALNECMDLPTSTMYQNQLSVKELERIIEELQFNT